MSKDTGGGVKPVQQKSKVELLFIPCGFPYFSNYLCGYLENKTLNMYGPIFQKDPPFPW